MFAQVGSVEVPGSPDAFYPAVGMHSLGEEVLLDLQAEWAMEEDDGQMIVDSHEDEWARLHDVKVTGTVSSDLGSISGKALLQDKLEKVIVRDIKGHVLICLLHNS